MAKYQMNLGLCAPYRSTVTVCTLLTPNQVKHSLAVKSTRRIFHPVARLLGVREVLTEKKADTIRVHISHTQPLDLHRDLYRYLEAVRANFTDNRIDYTLGE